MDKSTTSNAAAKSSFSSIAAVNDVSETLRRLLAEDEEFPFEYDWESFPRYHFLLDEQADHVFAMTDVIAALRRNSWKCLIDGRSEKLGVSG